MNSYDPKDTRIKFHLWHVPIEYTALGRRKNGFACRIVFPNWTFPSGVRTIQNPVVITQWNSVPCRYIFIVANSSVRACRYALVGVTRVHDPTFRGGSFRFALKSSVGTGQSGEPVRGVQCLGEADGGVSGTDILSPRTNFLSREPRFLRGSDEASVTRFSPRDGDTFFSSSSSPLFGEGACGRPLDTGVNNFCFPS